ncbi:MAG: hypothetical protein ACI4QI_02080 [Candidatus Coproplasma sp.]
MRIIKNIFSKFYLYLLWAMLSVIFVGWIFTLITDTVPRNKVTLYADVLAIEDLDLREELEKSKPDNIKMVKVHPFTYVAFGSSITGGDIYLVKESDIEEYISSFCPLDEEFTVRYADRGIYCNEEGIAYGIKVYDAATSIGCAMQYVDYSPAADEEAQDYYLFFNKDSLHSGTLSEANSSAALTIAHVFLAL